VTKPTGVGRGGARPGAGRPCKPPPPTPEPRIIFAAPPEVVRALEGIQRTLETQGADIARLQQQRRDGNEHAPLILRRLIELERLVRGDPGLTKPPRHTRARPLGIE
jgi:hypothetical protein